MRRVWFIVFGGLIAAAIAFAGAWFVGSAPCREMASKSDPELAWLQKEFQIPNSEFGRITKLHNEYSVACMKRCELIDAKNTELERLLASTNLVTPQIERTLQEAAQIRAECQSAMLQHFLEVSRTMPPDQGRRYLTWVINRTLGSQNHASMTFNAPATHEHHQ
jgi:hypothetical protein